MFENLDKLQDLEDRYLDLEAKISDPEVIARQEEWLKYTKAHSKLTEIVTVYRDYKNWWTPGRTMKPLSKPGKTRNSPPWRKRK